jgi:hypothetical protein
VLFGVLLEDRSLPSQCPVVARLARNLEGAGVAGRLVITFAVMLIALARLVGHLQDQAIAIFRQVSDFGVMVIASSLRRAAVPPGDCGTNQVIASATFFV